MAHLPLTRLDTPRVVGASMLPALTGWMDGVLVSARTVKHLMEERGLGKVARINPAGFYIDNFSGAMEIAALSRPHVKYDNLGVKWIIFMGSYGGPVPHAREPHRYGSVSERRLLPRLKQHGLKPTEYEGPGSFATCLLNLPVDSAGLREASTQGEIHVSEVVEEDKKLAATVPPLEEDYDNELIEAAEEE